MVTSEQLYERLMNGVKFLKRENGVGPACRDRGDIFFLENLFEPASRKAAEEFARAKEKNDLSLMKNVLSDKKEMIALDKYANKLSKVIEVIRNEQDSVRLSDNFTEPEKRLKIKELELREEKLYDQYLDVFKTKTAKN